MIICEIEEYIVTFDMMKWNCGAKSPILPPVSLLQKEMQVDRYVCLLQGGAIAPLWKVHW